MNIQIRREQSGDHDRVTRIIEAAFADHPHSDQTEHLIVSALRMSNALTVSLVAEADDELVGHIAFSKVTVDGEDNSWHGLGPVSVAPAYQGQGIGSKLIREGLKELKALNAAGCVLLGEPEYYQRFGFHQHPDLILEGVPPEYFMALPLEGEVPAGVVEYHEAFQQNH